MPPRLAACVSQALQKRDQFREFAGGQAIDQSGRHRRGLSEAVRHDVRLRWPQRPQFRVDQIDVVPALPPEQAAGHGPIVQAEDGIKPVVDRARAC